jgi:integration host factor subunit beta
MMDREKARLSCTAAGPAWQQRTAVVATLGHIVIGKRRWLVTKKDLAKSIAEEMGLTQLQAKEIVQKVFDGITATLLHEGRIELRNFGVFAVKTRQPRTARNPRTGEKVKVPARMVVTFKPGREMEERVGQLKKLPHGKA